MIQVNHFNDEMPPLDVAVLIVANNGNYRIANLVEFDSEILDVDDFNYVGHTWYNEDDDEHLDVSDYPFWTRLRFDLVNKSNRDEVGPKQPEGFSIPGYKIVGGVVVKV